MKSVLVCLGDVWTQNDAVNLKYYGSHLAELLNTDLIDLGKPGSSNYDIFVELTTVLPEIIKQYQKIYLVVTLNEIGLEFNQRNSWPLRVDFEVEPSTLNDFLDAYEQQMFKEFNNFLDQYTTVTAVLVRNFTFGYGKSVIRYIDQPWIEILDKKETYPKDLHILSSLPYSQIINYIKSQQWFSKFKNEIFETFCKMNDALDWFNASEYSDKNTTEQAHQLWAEYLYKKLK